MKVLVYFTIRKHRNHTDDINLNPTCWKSNIDIYMHRIAICMHVHTPTIASPPGFTIYTRK